MLYEVPPLMEEPVSARFAYVRTMIGVLEMLKQGVTAVHDDAFYVPKEMLERWNGPSAKLQNAIKNALMQRDVYILNRWNMLFVAPPLNVSEDEIAFGVKAHSARASSVTAASSTRLFRSSSNRLDS